MKEFAQIAFSFRQCRAELDDLGTLLQEHGELRENKQVLPFFRQRKHLSAFIGTYLTHLAFPDQIAFEYDVFGDFKADLVVGDAAQAQFCFVEFEDGSRTSIFKHKRGRATPEWSRRFEQGYSQVIDWLWKLDDQQRTTGFADRFGAGANYEGLLVIGRNVEMRHRETMRWKWRTERVVVGSKRVICLTYDELHEQLDRRLKIYENDATD